MCLRSETRAADKAEEDAVFVARTINEVYTGKRGDKNTEPVPDTSPGDLFLNTYDLIFLTFSVLNRAVSE